MRSLYQKSELAFSLVWIGAYCVLMSVADSISVNIGTEKIVTLPVSVLLSVALIIFIKSNGLFIKFGFCKSQVSAKSMLYYIPVLLMLTVNLWSGISIKHSVTEAVLYILTMLCVGFLEEVIFRGLLFNAMARDNIKAAVIVSSLTFGIGHIVNLINGSGASVFENLLQVLYACAAGFMFVMIYYTSESLIVCILSHGVFNALSIFADEALLTSQDRIISALFLVAVCGLYGLYLLFILKNKDCLKTVD